MTEKKELATARPARLDAHRIPRRGPRRVLMTADTVGGVWHYALDLARGLTASGIDVCIAAMGGRMSPGQRADAAGIEGLRIEDSDYRLEWMADPWDDVSAAGEWLLDLASDFRPDIIHLNNFAHGELPWGRPVLMVGHSCVYSWFRAVGRCAPSPEWARYGVEVARGLEAADMVTAPTQAMLDSLRTHYGQFRSAGPIHNGLQGDLFRPGKKDRLIFGAGRVWDSAKNLATLDSVAGNLPWPVEVAGSAEHPDGGTAAFQNATLLGVLDRPHMAERLGRASIYALPARYEPFGLSAVEAGLAGCALVLGDIPSLREVWGDAALYVSPDDPKQLSAALSLLISDPGRRERLARLARERASRYTIPRMVDAYLMLYRRIASSNETISGRRDPVRRLGRAGVAEKKAPRS